MKNVSLHPEFNAVRHGLLSRKLAILPGESRYGFRKLRQTLLAQYDPRTDVDAALVDYLAILFWRLKRALRIEGKITEEIEMKWEKDKQFGVSTPFDHITLDKLEQITRYVKSIEKAVFRTRHELERSEAKKNGEIVPLPQVVDISVDSHN